MHIRPLPARPRKFERKQRIAAAVAECGRRLVTARIEADHAAVPAASSVPTSTRSSAPSRVSDCTRRFAQTLSSISPARAAPASNKSGNRAARKEVEQRRRCFVQPLQIVDDQHEGLGFREALYERGNVCEKPIPVVEVGGAAQARPQG